MIFILLGDMLIKYSSFLSYTRCNSSINTYHNDLLLQNIMPPILQGPITLTPRITLRLLLLRQMPLTIRHHLPHMLNIMLRIPLWVPIRIMRKDIDDTAAAEFVFFRNRICGKLGNGKVPLVAYRFAGFALPARGLGLFFLEPGPEFGGGHVY